FLVLTIAADRLELARISRSVDERAQFSLLAAGLVLGLGVVLALVWPGIGYPILGLGLLGLVAWLFRHDVATRLVRGTGLPRYMAACLLAGYGWLVVVGTSWSIAAGPSYSGPGYDAVLHAVFLGFVMSMIMAHAPTILPAVLRRPLPYRPVLYAPALLLHASLLVRVLGDARGLPAMVQWGGVANIAAVLLFVLLAVVSVLLGAPRPRPAVESTSIPNPEVTS
ncbi:MAG: hypothetical protein H7311_08115, partial [Ramlibacter sp.]|nr:hypothetical protein [Cryobacterium sp.]